MTCFQKNKLTVLRVKVEMFPDDYLLDLFNECYKNSREINDVNFQKEDFKSWSEVQLFYGDLPYSVADGQEVIGFFFDDYDSRSNAIGLSVYIKEQSPREGVTNLKKIIYSGTMSNYIKYKFKKVKYLEFNTYSRTIVEFVRKLIPNIGIHEIRKEYIMMYGEIDLLDLSKVSNLFRDNLTVFSPDIQFFEFLLPSE